MKKFNFKTKKEFVELPIDKRVYYLARLYIKQDITFSKLPYTSRLFMCANYLKKQDPSVLSILYNYLKDNTHKGLKIWEILPKAVLYDQQQRRNINHNKQVYIEFNEKMLDDVIGVAE